MHNAKARASKHAERDENHTPSPGRPCKRVARIIRRDRDLADLSIAMKKPGCAFDLLNLAGEGEHKLLVLALEQVIVAILGKLRVDNGHDSDGDDLFW
ncbi:MAG: hypothetical protein CL912_26315 [Deltaproteobacteria bacterium]|nr:hypothetical protein [Deltaproteobacteria bacterium]